MTNFTPSFDPTALYADGDDFKHRNITIAQSAVLVRGTVLGRVTGSDKYIASVATATDGSQNPVAILAPTTVDASAADVITPAYFEGVFAYEKLTVDASWSFATLEAAFRKNNIPIYLRSIGVLG